MLLERILQGAHDRALGLGGFLAKRPRGACHTPLHLPHGPAFPDRAPGELAGLHRVLEGEQRPRMSLGQRTPFQHLTDRGRQVEEPDEVGDRGAVLPDGAGDLCRLHPELRAKRRVPLRLLDGIELLALKVLHQGEHEERVVVGIPHHHRDLAPAEPRDGPQPALAGHQLEAIGGARRRPNDERLKESVLSDRLAELVQLGLREHAPRLQRVRHDGRDRHPQDFPGRRFGLQVLAQERPQPAAQTVAAHEPAPAPIAA